MTSTTRRLAVAAAGLMVLAQGAASAADPPALTTPVHVTKEDVNPVRTYSAPNLLAHPKDPMVVVGAFADLRTRRCGLVRTVDGGTTWTTLCTAPFVGQGFYDLIVDPGDSNHLLAGTTRGLYVSTNGGTSWTLRRGARTWSLAIAPGGGPSAEILAACSDGLWRSTNGGTTWTAVALPGAPG